MTDQKGILTIRRRSWTKSLESSIRTKGRHDLLNKLADITGGDNFNDLVLSFASQQIL